MFGSWFDPFDRAGIAASYQSVIVGLRPTVTSWNGNLATGNAGTTSQTWKDAVLSRINFMRAFAGVPPVITLNSTYNTKDQDAAMMMSSNNDLSHTPPPSWINYTPAGAEAAGNSNLCLGYTNDPGCIEAYMRDEGSNNAIVGHRRWLIYPQTQQMGTGDIPPHSGYLYANANWVFDGRYETTRPATRDLYVPWPPRGYVPNGIVPGRWSFSYPGADFANASATMTRGATNISVTLEPVATGYGENSLVWIPSSPVPSPLTGDTTITVTVSNYRLSGVAQSTTYDVIVFDPTTSQTLTAPTLTSPANGATNVPASTTLTWSAASGATSYDVYFGTSSNPPFLANVTGTSQAVNSLQSGTVYYWKVVAKAGASTAASTTFSFTSATTLAAPAPISPSNGLTNVSTSTTLEWSASAGATSYDVYLGTANPPPLVTNTASTSHPVSGLASGTTYYWKIIAKAGTSTAESSAYSFSTAAASISPPTLTAPANGATGIASTGATLTWNAVANATSYDVYFGTVNNPPLLVNVTTTSQSTGPLVLGTTYYWKVVAKLGNSTAESQTFSFTTASVTAPTLTAPANGATGIGTSTNLTWTVPAGATSYDVYFGVSNNPPLLTTTISASQNVFSLQPGTTYYWKVVSKAGASSASSVTFSFATAGTSTTTSGYYFRTIAPCRIADTRQTSQIPAGGTRDAGMTGAPCNIPASATAVAVNVTAVPKATLGFLTLWPAGQARPLASTLNAPNGGIVANAAVVPLGAAGALSVFVSDASDVIIDASGYFLQDPTASAFYALNPCRAADTRNAGEILDGSRSFPIACGVPTTAVAASLNATVVPSSSLSYLTLWPTGGNQPFVSTLNAPTGKITANAAIVPTGNAGAVSAFATNPTHLILDVNGYFAPPAPNGLAFYPVTPCRVADTRNTTVLTGTRDFQIVGVCGIPASAQAFALNTTVVPRGPLAYLTLWPAGQTQPFVSTLNSPDGSIVANAAIVPAGTNGSVSVYVTNATDVILDINGYFAP